MAATRGVFRGPKWPVSLRYTTAPAHANPGTLDADDERLIFIGQVQWDDGASHDCDAIEFRTNSNTIVCTDFRVGLADIDTATGPPGRDDGTLDQYTTYNFNNPGAQNLNTVFNSASTSRTLAHGAQIAVVAKVEVAPSSGTLQFFTMQALAGYGPMRPQITSFLGGAYANVTGNMPTFSFHATDGHYGVMRGGIPHLTAAPITVTIDADTSTKRAGLGFTLAAPVTGIEGTVMVVNVAAGDIVVALYDSTTLLDSMTVDANTWGADATVQAIEFCFPDVALTTSGDYTLSVDGASTACQIYTVDVTTDNRWDPITNGAGGGTVGYREFNASWGALDESRLPWGFTWNPVKVDDGAGGSGGLLGPNLRGNRTT